MAFPFFASTALLLLLVALTAITGVEAFRLVSIVRFPTNLAHEMHTTIPSINRTEASCNGRNFRKKYHAESKPAPFSAKLHASTTIVFPGNVSDDGDDTNDGTRTMASLTFITVAKGRAVVDVDISATGKVGKCVRRGWCTRCTYDIDCSLRREVPVVAEGTAQATVTFDPERQAFRVSAHGHAAAAFDAGVSLAQACRINELERFALDYFAPSALMFLETRLAYAVRRLFSVDLLLELQLPSLFGVPMRAASFTFLPPPFTSATSVGVEADVHFEGVAPPEYATDANCFASSVEESTAARQIAHSSMNGSIHHQPAQFEVGQRPLAAVVIAPSLLQEVLTCAAHTEGVFAFDAKVEIRDAFVGLHFFPSLPSATLYPSGMLHLLFPQTIAEISCTGLRNSIAIEGNFTVYNLTARLAVEFGGSASGSQQEQQQQPLHLTLRLVDFNGFAGSSFLLLPPVAWLPQATLRDLLHAALNRSIPTVNAALAARPIRLPALAQQSFFGLGRAVLSFPRALPGTCASNATFSAPVFILIEVFDTSAVPARIAATNAPDDTVRIYSFLSEEGTSSHCELRSGTTVVASEIAVPSSPPVDASTDSSSAAWQCVRIPIGVESPSPVNASGSAAATTFAALRVTHDATYIRMFCTADCSQCDPAHDAALQQEGPSSQTLLLTPGTCYSPSSNAAANGLSFTMSTRSGCGLTTHHTHAHASYDAGFLIASVGSCDEQDATTRATLARRRQPFLYVDDAGGGETPCAMERQAARNGMGHAASDSGSSSNATAAQEEDPPPHHRIRMSQASGSVTAFLDCAAGCQPSSCNIQGETRQAKPKLTPPAPSSSSSSPPPAATPRVPSDNSTVTTTNRFYCFSYSRDDPVDALVQSDSYVVVHAAEFLQCVPPQPHGGSSSTKQVQASSGRHKDWWNAWPVPLIIATVLVSIFLTAIVVCLPDFSPMDDMRAERPFHAIQAYHLLWVFVAAVMLQTYSPMARFTAWLYASGLPGVVHTARLHALLLVWKDLLGFVVWGIFAVMLVHWLGQVVACARVGRQRVWFTLYLSFLGTMLLLVLTAFLLLVPVDSLVTLPESSSSQNATSPTSDVAANEGFAYSDETRTVALRIVSIFTSAAFLPSWLVIVGQVVSGLLCAVCIVRLQQLPSSAEVADADLAACDPPMSVWSCLLGVVAFLFMALVYQFVPPNKALPWMCILLSQTAVMVSLTLFARPIQWCLHTFLHGKLLFDHEPNNVLLGVVVADLALTVARSDLCAPMLPAPYVDLAVHFLAVAVATTALQHSCAMARLLLLHRQPCRRCHAADALPVPQAWDPPAAAAAAAAHPPGQATYLPGWVLQRGESPPRLPSRRVFLWVGHVCLAVAVGMDAYTFFTTGTSSREQLAEQTAAQGITPIPANQTTPLDPGLVVLDAALRLQMLLMCAAAGAGMLVMGFDALSPLLPLCHAPNAPSLPVQQHAVYAASSLVNLVVVCLIVSSKCVVFAQNYVDASNLDLPKCAADFDALVLRLLRAAAGGFFALLILRDLLLLLVALPPTIVRIISIATSVSRHTCRFAMTRAWLLLMTALLIPLFLMAPVAVIVHLIDTPLATVLGMLLLVVPILLSALNFAVTVHAVLQGDGAGGGAGAAAAAPCGTVRRILQTLLQHVELLWSLSTIGCWVVLLVLLSQTYSLAGKKVVATLTAPRLYFGFAAEVAIPLVVALDVLSWLHRNDNG